MSGIRRADRATDKLTIQAIIATQGVRTEIKRERVATLVMERELNLDGLFIREVNTDKAYFATKNEVFSLTDVKELTAYIHNEYGINAASDWMKAVVAHFVTKGLRNGERKVGRRFVAFDTKTEVLYVTRWDGRVRRLDGATITEISNGEETFFFDDDGGHDVDLVLPINGVTSNIDPTDELTMNQVDVAPHGVLLPYLTDLAFAQETLGDMSPDQQKMLLTTWVFSVAFPDLVTSKPILILEGAPGAGKSVAAIMLQAVIHGKEHGMIVSKDGEKDFPVQLLRSPIAVFDNVDSYIEWVPDAICAYTTVGKWEKRKLYSDDAQMTIAPLSFPVIASKNPSSFRREDVADRSIILRLDRRTEGNNGGFKPMQHLMADLRNQRPRLFGEYLYWCNQIVAAIRAGSWRQCETYVSQFRQADFAQMAFLVGDVFGWDVNDIVGALEALTREQRKHSCENDDLVEVLIGWIRHYGAINGERFHTTREIFTQIEQHMLSLGNKMKFNEAMLASRLRMGYLGDTFDVEKKIDRISGHHKFRIKMSTQGAAAEAENGPDLSNVIPMPSPDFNRGR